MKKLLIGLVLLACAAPASALTLSDIETAVRTHIRDTSSSSSLQQFSDTKLDATINEVQRDVVNKTWCVENSTAVTLVAATTYYSMPTDLIVPFRVTFTDASREVIELTETSQVQIVKLNPDFERNSSGEPTEYFIRQSTSGGNPLEMGVNPIPTSASTGTVKMDYAAQATDLSSDSDVPFNGLNSLYQFHEVLVWGATYRIKLAQNKSAEAANYLTLYTEGVKEMKARLNEMPNYSINFKGRNR